MICQPTQEQVRRVTRSRGRAYSGPGFGPRSFECLGIGIGIGLEFSPPAAAPASTPLTIITSVAVRQWIRGDLGITTATGVSAWADQSGNNHHFAQAVGIAQPLYTAVDATLNGKPSVTGDGSNDAMTNATLPIGAGIWVSGIIKMVTWVSGRATWGGLVGDVCDLLTNGSTPTLALYNNFIVNNNGGLSVGSWGRVEAYYANTTSAYLKLRGTTATGAAVGAASGTGCSLFSSGGVAWTNHAIAERIVCAGPPTPAEVLALEAYYVGRYTQANVA